MTMTQALEAFKSLVVSHMGSYTTLTPSGYWQMKVRPDAMISGFETANQQIVVIQGAITIYFQNSIVDVNAGEQINIKKGTRCKIAANEESTIFLKYF